MTNIVQFSAFNKFQDLEEILIPYSTLDIAGMAEKPHSDILAIFDQLREECGGYIKDLRREANTTPLGYWRETDSESGRPYYLITEELHHLIYDRADWDAAMNASIEGGKVRGWAKELAKGIQALANLHPELIPKDLLESAEGGYDAILDEIYFA